MEVKMTRTCAVLQCISSANMPERKFFRFPMLNMKSAKSLALTKTRQDAWVTALNRLDFFPSNFKSATVCDLRFVSGRSALYSDVNKVPTLNMGYEAGKDYDTEPHELAKQDLPNEQPPSAERSDCDKQTQTDLLQSISVGTQTEDDITVYVREKSLAIARSSSSGSDLYAGSKSAVKYKRMTLSSHSASSDAKSSSKCSCFFTTKSEENGALIAIIGHKTPHSLILCRKLSIMSCISASLPLKAIDSSKVLSNPSVEVLKETSWVSARFGLDVQQIFSTAAISTLLILGTSHLLSTSVHDIES
ncbi:hypothetical protein Bhyg_12370 [Pseudolycoriella hygida]|uniref:THAP-type domain-containing protein n=1 Tax=Pseudolycoriella hygida TaxID=35572 RepID=A0A9Q0MX78_9DIPT|nr:hypothetical protein Bhyg_12370 [Pseudolycoriella hygida]